MTGPGGLADPARGRPDAGAWRRTLWPLVRATLFRCSYHNWYGFRRGLLRLFGASVDSTVRIRPTVRIDRPWNLSMGRKSSLGDGCVLWAHAPITIGSRSVCSQYTVLCTWELDPADRRLESTTRPIAFGDDVWIAAECFVAAGSEVNDGVVVGARSVVRGRLPAWMICSGDPAIALKPRPYQGRPAGPS